MRKLLFLGVSLVGLFVSGFLLWEYTSATHSMACLGIGCDVARASSYAHILGIPTPALGVALYSMLTLLVFAELLAGEKLLGYIRLVTVLLATGGFLGSIFFTYIEAFVIHAWCVWCVTSAVCAALLFLLAVLEFFRPSTPVAQESVKTPLLRYATLLVLAVVVSVPAFKLLAHTEDPPAPPAKVSPEMLKEYLIRPDSHATGDLQSPVSVVEFGDFQCPFCGNEEKVVRKIRAKYGDRVRFVFRHFPLRNMHAYAEQAAEASECAAEQGKFWQAFEMFYDHQDDLTMPALEHYAKELGLDRTRFEQCVSSGSTAARIERDEKDGKTLGVDRTPTFFIDGERFLGGLDEAQFSHELDAALARHGIAPQANSQQPAAELAAKAATQPSGSPKGEKSNGAASQPVAGSLGSFGSSAFSQAGSLTACSEEEAKQRQPDLIGTDEAHRIYEQGAKSLFVDVRSEREFKAGRIAKSINIPVDEMEKRWNDLPKDREIVLYEGGTSANPDEICASGRAAGRFLLSHGFSSARVKVYRDGLKAWEKAGLPIDHASLPAGSPSGK